VVDFSGQLEKEIGLKDQFGVREATVGGPVAYAVPVVKEYRDKRYEIIRDDLHLTIFRLSPRRIRKQIRVSDQFGRYGLGPWFTAMLLAVPGRCQEWKQIGDE
jgi:hypothetical protein